MNRQIGWSTESNLLWQIGNQIDRMTGVIGSTLSTFVPQSRTLTINGVTYDLSANRSWTIAAGITGSGVAGQVAYWNGTSSQTGSNNLFWNNANSRLGIATNSPSYKLDIASEASGNTGIRIAGLNTNASVVDLFSSTTHVGAFFGTGSSLSFGTYQSSQVSLESYSTGGVSLRTNNGANAHIRFYAGNASASQSPEIARFFSTTGNLVLQNGGTFADAGFRLDINGTARVSSDASINGLTIGRGGGNQPQNTALGAFALSANTTGDFNVSVGYSTMGSSSSNESVSVGAFSLSNAGGTRNVAIGTSSMRQNSTGSDNTSVGANSFGGITSGSNNIALGRLAGRWITGGAIGNTICNNSIFIGQNTKALADNQNNQIVIGYDETGLGSNTTIIGNSSTTLTALRGSLISGGTSVNASAQVQVDSTTKGFLPPRMTNAQKNAIGTPAAGLQVYDTTLNQMSYYNGTTWINF
jgi:hypothetical protein